MRTILLILWIAAFGSVGVLAYAGRFPPRWFARGATFERTTGPTWPYAFLFHAAAMTTFLLAPLFPAGSIPAALFWVGAVLNAVAVVGIVWLPAFLLPTWRRNARRRPYR